MGIVNHYRRYMMGKEWNKSCYVLYIYRNRWLKTAEKHFMGSFNMMISLHGIHDGKIWWCKILCTLCQLNGTILWNTAKLKIWNVQILVYSRINGNYTAQNGILKMIYITFLLWYTGNRIFDFMGIMPFRIPVPLSELRIG